MDIKETINKFFNLKKINSSEVNNKYNCQKKNLKFELNIVNINESNGAYIIKSFQKSVNDMKLKNTYYNTIFKLINNIK